MATANEEPLRLTVFGASGRTGSLLVEQALAAGHEVCAFVRDKEKLGLEDDRLEIIEGDAYTGENVPEAISDAEAVLSALGQGENTPDDLLTVAGEHIIEAMRAEGTERLVTLVGAGVRHEDDEVSFGGKLVVGVMKVVAGDTLLDAREHVSSMRGTDLDFTVVRPPRLTGGEHTGNYRTGSLTLGPRNSISRADVADFMLSCVENDEYVREMPMVSD